MSSKLYAPQGYSFAHLALVKVELLRRLQFDETETWQGNTVAICRAIMP
jgi:hypothetical protein